MLFHHIQHNLKPEPDSSKGWALVFVWEISRADSRSVPPQPSSWIRCARWAALFRRLLLLSPPFTIPVRPVIRLGRTSIMNYRLLFFSCSSFGVGTKHFLLGPCLWGKSPAARPRKFFRPYILTAS